MSEPQEGRIILHPTASLFTTISKIGVCWLVTGHVREGLHPGKLCANGEIYYPNIIAINVLARPRLR